MVKPAQRAEINTFVQGLITEASPLNFPPNASVDELNFELNRDGTRDRRLGMDFEESFTYRSTTTASTNYTDTGFNTFKWYSAAGDSDNEFLVVQVGRELQIFDLLDDKLSAEGYKSTITLSSFPTTVRFSFAAIEGRLVIASGYDTIAVVTYASGVFSTEYIRLKVRDMWGMEVLSESKYETDPTYRGTLYTHHAYNLYNQSWGVPRKNKSGVLSNPVALYVAAFSKAPSNSEVVWTGLQYQPVVGSDDPYERVYPNLYEETLGADLKAAKGYFIIDALRRGQSRNDALLANYTKYPQINLSSVVDAKVDYTPGGATVVAEFAGRVFYAGFGGEVVDGDKRSPDLSNHILFSQLVKNVRDLEKCYQEGDPTSRDNSDIVDTDGGFLRVSGARKIVALRNIGTHLVIIADNGVWTITGGGDYGFSATNYMVSNISNYGCISEASIVTEGSSIYFWSEDGIYVVTKDQMGDLAVKNITQITIQSMYENIPNTSKKAATGVYDQFAKKIKWLYKTGTPFSSSSVTMELVLDLVLGAFYPMKIGNANNNSLEVVSMFQAPPEVKGSSFESVLAGTDSVVAGTDVVGITETVRTSGVQAVKYLVLNNSNATFRFTFAQYNNVNFLDWEEVDGVGVDAKAYVLTGSVIAGDSAIHKQVPYLIMHFRRTEVEADVNGVPLNQSSCKVRSQWDWANSAASNKWSPLFQAYRLKRQMFVSAAGDYDTGFETTVTRNKLRGRGRAFALYMETEPGKDCRILGWNLTVNANSVT